MRYGEYFGIAVDQAARMAVPGIDRLTLQS
jgi:hypothetical protein